MAGNEGAFSAKQFAGGFPLDFGGPSTVQFSSPAAIAEGFKKSGRVVTGDREVIALFQSLDDKMKKKALRPVLRSNAKIVLKAAKANLRAQQESGTGALSRSLKVRAMKRSRVKIGSAVQLIPHHTQDEFYGLFLEFGLTKTKPPRRWKIRGHVVARAGSGRAERRKIIGQGKSTGDLPAQPFLRPALYDNREKLIRNTVEKLRRWIATLQKGGAVKDANKAVRAA